MVWVRVDNRLVHGQVIESWLPFTHARVLLVVNDALAQDPLRQEIMRLAIPSGVRILFTGLADAGAFVKNHINETVLALFVDCQDAQTAYERGFLFDSLNVGNLHYGPGKRQVCAHVAVSREDEKCLFAFENAGVELDFRCLPSDSLERPASFGGGS